MMNYEKITPFVCFGWGCDFALNTEETGTVRSNVNGDKFCANCLSLLMPYPKTSISDLEKIEPLNPRNVSSEYWNATHENRAKLNEVIEKVNRIMEVMNRR